MAQLAFAGTGSGVVGRARSATTCRHTRSAAVRVGWRVAGRQRSIIVRAERVESG